MYCGACSLKATFHHHGLKVKLQPPTDAITDVYCSQVSEDDLHTHNDGSSCHTFQCVLNEHTVCWKRLEGMFSKNPQYLPTCANKKLSHNEGGKKKNVPNVPKSVKIQELPGKTRL